MRRRKKRKRHTTLTIQFLSRPPFELTWRSGIYLVRVRVNLVLFSASVEIRDLKEKGEGEDGGCYTLPARVSAVSAAYISPVIVACPVRAAAQIATHSTRSLTSSTHTHTHMELATILVCIVYIFLSPRMCVKETTARASTTQPTCNIHLIT